MYFHGLVGEMRRHSWSGGTIGQEQTTDFLIQSEPTQHSSYENNNFFSELTFTITTCQLLF